MKKMSLLSIALAGVVGFASNALAEIKLTYSDWQLAQEVWGKSLNDVIDQFEKENPGIKVRP